MGPKSRFCFQINGCLKKCVHNSTEVCTDCFRFDRFKPIRGDNGLPRVSISKEGGEGQGEGQGPEKKDF